jgi:hypothetical protein
MTYFLRYWKLGAAALLLACTFSAGWYFNGLRLTAKLETERRQVAEDARALVEQAQKQAYEADERYRKAQEAAPKAAPKIREVVRENHSDCVRPAAVDRGLRDAIRSGNKSISSHGR